jgi:hypothetical protein
VSGERVILWLLAIMFLFIARIETATPALKPAHFQILRATVCEERVTLVSRPLPPGADVFGARPFVNGHELDTVGVGRPMLGGYNAVEGSAFGVMMRARQHRHIVTITVASVRSNCARFKFVLGWR